MTTTPHGEVLVQMERDDASRKLIAHADTTAGVMTRLDERLWLEGNLSVDYGEAASDGTADFFSLQFNPDEVERALEIPVQSAVVEVNSWYPGLFESTPNKVVCFPYAQHFVTASFHGAASDAILDKQALIAEVEKLGDLSGFTGFSAKPIKRQLVIGMSLSALLTSSLLIYTLIDLLGK